MDARQRREFLHWFIVLLLVLTGVYVYSTLELLAIEHTFPAPVNEAIKSLLVVPPPRFTVYAPWGLMVATYIFLVTTGLCIVSSWGKLFGVERYEAISRRAAWLALVTLVIGLIAIAVEVGRTERAIEFYIGYDNLRSNMMWMIIFYTGYALFLPFEVWILLRRDIAVLAKRSRGWRKVFYYILTLGVTGTSEESYRRDMRIARVLSGIVLVISVGAYANMASIFSTTRTFPFHGNPLLQLVYMPVFFVVIGTLLGLALTAVTILAASWAEARPLTGVEEELLGDVRRLTLYFTAAYAALLAVWTAIAPYTKLPDPLALGLEWGLGVAAPLALLLPRRGGRWRIAAASASIMVAGFALRYDFVVGRPLVLTRLVPYTPSPLEVMYMVGAFAFCTLVAIIGELLLPLGGLRGEEGAPTTPTH